MGRGLGFFGMVLVLVSGSHNEELHEETVEAPETGEVIRIGSAGVAFDVVNGAEERLAAVDWAGAGWREEGVGGGSRDGGGRLRVRCSVAESDVCVGAEERYDEDAGEELEGAAGFAEAQHLAVRGRGVGWGCRFGGCGHGSFTLGTASHGWIEAGAGF